jgi:hypothetical protein
MLLHNMSCPPRTEVRAEMRRVADRIVIFSLVHALIARGVLESPEEPGKLPQNDCGDLRVTVCARWPSPNDLFSRTGLPKPLPVEADFLIGWRIGALTDSYYFCPDPQIVGGVLARCSGNLYLARRNPDLSWERLLAAPIAFDEPAISALFQ